MTVEIREEKKKIKENSSVTSEFLITSTAHVWSLNFLGLPFLQESLVSAYSPLRWPFFHTLIWLTGEQHSGAGAAHVPHQSRSAWMWESERVLKRHRAAAHPGPDLSSVQHQLTWEGESNTLAEATVSNLTTKKKNKNYNSEWHKADPLMAEKTKVWERKNSDPIPLHRFGSQGSCTWSLKAAVSGNNFAAVDAAATPLLFA